jgi:hypothetical protein
MRSYEFIPEVEQLTHITKKKGKQSKADPTTRQELIDMGAKMVGKMSSGHEIWEEPVHGAYNNWVSYDAVNPNGLVDLTVGANEKKNVMRDLNLYAINPNNTLKAHNFYAYLITKLNKVLVASQQSSGGENVWVQLQRFHHNTIDIHGWLNGKPVNVDMRDREQTHAPDPGWPENNKQPQEVKDARKMELVAYKK